MSLRGEAFKLVDNDKGYKELLRKALGKFRPTITVGLHAKEGGAEHDEGTTLADVATWNEFGTGTIPERSFLRAWFDENQGRIKEVIVRLLTDVVVGKITEEMALQRLGLWMQGEVQKRIANSIPPPNAASTITAKGSSTPLIDTGQLRAGITFKVEGIPNAAQVNEASSAAQAAAEARKTNTGRRGGVYYINKNGNRTYLKRPKT